MYYPPMEKFMKYLPAFVISCGMLALPALAQNSLPHEVRRPGYHPSGTYVAKIKTSEHTLVMRAKKIARAEALHPAPTATPEPGPEKDGVWETASTFLITRISQMDIDTKIRQMKADGQTEYKGVIAFDAEGALFYNREIWRRFKHHDGEEEEQRADKLAERTKGLQILPYKIGILSDGSARVSVGLLGFRNQDPRHPFDGVLRKKGSFQAINKVPQFVLAADFLIFEWDDHFSQQNLSTRELKIGAVKFKYPLAQDATRVNVLALTAGGSIGVAQANARLADDRGIIIGGEKNIEQGFAVKSDSEIGLNYSHYSESENGSNLQIGVDLKNSRISGAGLDLKQPLYLKKVRQFSIERKMWDDAVQQWLIDKNLPNDGGNYDSEYMLFNGGMPPIPPHKPKDSILVQSTVVSPHVSYQFPLSHGNGPEYFNGSTLAKHPTMLQISVGANIPLSNTIKGEHPNGTSIEESFAAQMDKFHASVGITF